MDADIVEKYSQYSEFATVLAGTTMLVALAPESVPSADKDPESIDYPELARRSVIFGFDALEDASTRPGTDLYLRPPDDPPPAVRVRHRRLHAHRPGADRSAREGGVHPPAAVRQHADAGGPRHDPGQRRAGRPDPIIILQSDEGPWPPGFTADQKNFKWLEASDEEIGWKFRILNAYRMPGVDLAAQGFTDDIGPVNAFRILFNAYFGAHLDLLPG